jgi:N-sulfoglucosamine sulfohydrolase
LIFTFWLDSSSIYRMKPTVSVFLIFLASLVVVGAADSRPNILYCLADDWSWPHAGAYGDKTIHTPTFDRVAREGMLFNYCFSATPSCTPSRAAMLTGQYPHRLEQGSCLWGFLPNKFVVYPDLLEKSGYAVGATRKGWGPGDFKAGGFTRNPAGPMFADFATFMKKVPADKPFCFWFGSHDPHRAYPAGSGAASGLKTDKVSVPPFWPDNETSKSDVLDYYFAVQRYDREVGEMLALLEQNGKLENTIVVMTGDNGWPFPRCKANLYDGGTRQPLAVRWPARVTAGQVCDDFINLMDLAPTFLEAAGLEPRPEMTGRSFLGLLTGKEKFGSRNVVYVERERHANVRAGDAGYPMRAVRTREFLYIRNLRPDRWPAGDPDIHKDPPRPFGDCDAGPTKQYILDHRNDPEIRKYFELCFEKRPAEELYDLRKDPHEINNVIGLPEYAAARKECRAQLDQWMKESADPRAAKDDDHWDKYPYFGGAAAGSKKAKGKAKESN